MKNKCLKTIIILFISICLGVTKDHVQSAMLKKKLTKSCLTTHMKEMEILAYKSAGVKK